MDIHSLLSFAGLVVSCAAYIVLKDKEHIQLNDASGGKSINASTSNRLAFDEKHNILYVVAREPRRLTAFILDATDSATLLAEKVFSSHTEGYPLDVEVCYPSGQQAVPRLAVSFEDPVSASAEGSVHIFQPLTPLDSELKLIKIVTVGPEPVDLEFGQDCQVLLVANRGRPTKEAGSVYRDPEGTVSKISLPHDLSPDSPITTTLITFDSVFTGDSPAEDILELRAMNFRHHPLRDPRGNLLTIMQSIEPERLVISPNGQVAYVSLPKNNAIARLALQFDLVTRVFPLGNRSWTDYHMDPSDRDHKISLRGYHVYSLSQTTEMHWLTKGDDEWIVTLDTGRLGYTEAYGYADHERAKTLVQNGDIVTSDSTLEAQLLDDSELGRLFVSNEDGRSPATGKIENVFTFGGRGFGIRDANNFETPTVIVDGVERVTERYYSNVFNTAYMANADTPQSDKEATSPSLGPELTAMDVGEFEGKTVLFVGGGSSGILYVYMLSPEARCLQPYFHSVHRTGSIYSSWQSAYADGHMGDVGITDIKYLHTSDLRPVLAVASAASNSVSIYQVADEPFSQASHN